MYIAGPKTPPSSFQEECVLLASYHRWWGTKDDIDGRVDRSAGIGQARCWDRSRRNYIFGYRRQARSGINISYLHRQVSRNAPLRDMHSGSVQHSSVLDGKGLYVCRGRGARLPLGVRQQARLILRLGFRIRRSTRPVDTDGRERDRGEFRRAGHLDQVVDVERHGLESVLHIVTRRYRGWVIWS